MPATLPAIACLRSDVLFSAENEAGETVATVKIASKGDPIPLKKVIVRVQGGREGRGRVGDGPNHQASFVAETPQGGTNQFAGVC